MLSKRRGRFWTGRILASSVLSLGLLAVAPTVQAQGSADPGLGQAVLPDLAPAAPESASVMVQRRIAHAMSDVLIWYERTPASERIVWGGLAACVVLGLFVALERMICLRTRAIIPNDFTARFLDRLHEGKLDGGKALDYCEMNPSPAARVALAAVRRWGRSAIDLERAVALAHRWESERLRRNVGTLRRITILAPLLGVLGALLAVDRVMTEAGESTLAWSALADSLWPLIFGVSVGTVALVVYDFAATRIERLGGALDRLGAETIDAIAMTTPVSAPTFPSTPHVRIGDPKIDRGSITVSHAREARPPRRPS